MDVDEEGCSDPTGKSPPKGSEKVSVFLFRRRPRTPYKDRRYSDSGVTAISPAEKLQTTDIEDFALGFMNEAQKAIRE
ncbi:hypothetical protein CEXT_764701 [Caerostris extrusa]|uniref:Uncharacterized protein n=1 Tax=Caerostris extrusa TaxID=172846 RepID=A0AAV4VKM5_CAEEX|nr:hypothetical protein CEXT_764701 [Caerostris extrusa]